MARLRFVIRCAPVQSVENLSQPSYYGKAGNITRIKCLAAKFGTFGDAENFAKAMGIRLGIAAFISPIFGEEQSTDSQIS